MTHVFCRVCGAPEDLRCGVCFDCASDAEAIAARRSVLQHIVKGVGHLTRWQWTNARICFAWAKERATRTGDYKPGGEFESAYGIVP